MKELKNIESQERINKRSKNMRIGIDIDGVLTDMEQFQLDYGTKFAYENYNKELINPEKYEIKDMFNMSREVYDEFWDTYFLDYVINEKPRKFADEITNKLHQEGYEVYIITARYFTENDNKKAEGTIEQVISKWLNQNNIYFDKIIFSPEDKLEICSNNKIELMIEDAPYNINSLSTIIPVICFNAGYNKECNGNNIYRCYSWYDIYSKIRHINKNKE